MTLSTKANKSKTRFALFLTTFSASECPIGLTCQDNGKWNAVMVDNIWSDEAVVPIKGTWNQDGMVDGSHATFCVRLRPSPLDADDIKGLV